MPPMAPFTPDSQMYITVSKSEKNKGRYYYGYSGNYLNWVDPAKLGGYLSTLQTDGVKWYFAPGVIEPEVADKLQLSKPPSLSSQYLQPPPQQQQSYQPPPQQYQPQQQFPTTPAPQPPPQVQVTPVQPKTETNQKWVEEIRNLSDQVSDLREIMCRVNACLVEYNTQYKLNLSLKRQRMVENVDLKHTMPGNFGPTTSGEGSTDEDVV